MAMIFLMQLRLNKKSKHYGDGGILVDFRLTQPSWTLWRSWLPARTTRTTCRRSSGPSTSLPSWPTLVRLNTLRICEHQELFYYHRMKNCRPASWSDQEQLNEETCRQDLDGDSPSWDWTDGLWLHFLSLSSLSLSVLSLSFLSLFFCHCLLML